MAGAIAAAAASLTITAIHTPPIWDWKAQLIAVIPLTTHRIWQAFLLFRRNALRFILWSALPLALCLNWVYVEPFWLSKIVISAVLLINVRQRAWIWLMAGVLAIWLYEHGPRLSYLAGEVVIETIQKAFGPLPASTLHLWRVGSLQNGAWLLAESIYALAIAWWMPPVKSKGLRIPTPVQVVS